MDTIGWLKVGDTNYRKWDIYDMTWENANLERFHISGAPYGGPIAIALHQGQKQAVKVNNVSEITSLEIFSASGKKIAESKWKLRERFCCMQWTTDETLVCVMKDGRVELYVELHALLIGCCRIDIDGMHMPQSFDLAPGFRVEVIHAAVSGSSLAVLARRESDDSKMVFFVQDVKEGYVQELDDSVLPGTPTAIGLVDALLTKRNEPIVIVTTAEGEKNGNMVLYTGSKSRIVKLKNVLTDPVVSITVSPQGKWLALMCERGKLCFLAVDLSAPVVPCDTKVRRMPDQICWCGEGAVVIYWKGVGLMLFDKGGNWKQYAYRQPVHLVQELDCTRIISGRAHEVLQAVPACLNSIRAVGSMAPAAMLVDALSFFEDGNARADEDIRLIRESEDGALTTAIDDCLEAALWEWYPTQQKSLIRAAAYGRSFVDEPEPDALCDAGRKLRVLNHLRRYDIAIPITSEQYDALTPEVVVERLVRRRRHMAALDICDHLEIPKHKVLVHWACYKIRNDDGLSSDDQLFELIHSRVTGCHDISFAQISAVARNVKRQGLATRLLGLETRVADQVSLLLEMGEEELALEKAVASGDTDLIYRCILKLILLADEDEEGLFRLVSKYPESKNLFIKYCRFEDPDTLRSFYEYGQFRQLGLLLAREAVEAEDVNERLLALRSAAEHFARGVSHGQKDLSFFQKATENQGKLSKLHCELQKKVHQPFLNFSVNLTLYNCFRVYPKAVKDIKQEFQVEDLRFGLVRARALVKERRWDDFRIMAKERKAPAAELLLEVAESGCAHADILRDLALLISDSSVRVERLMRLEEFVAAGRVAYQIKDLELLEQVRNAASRATGTVQAELEKLWEAAKANT